MLQIITGKFFKTDNLYTTRQRGVLYANARLFEPVETASGTLLPAEADRDLACWIYEVDQRLEATNPDGTASFLVGVGADYLIQDFAAVASFVLNVTCAPDADLVRRLTQSAHPPLGVPDLPRTYVRGVFDREGRVLPDDGARLTTFVADLVGLDRRTYEAAMRAIRRYVTGLHRIGDDLPLAYALLVASVESLAQDFDAFAPEWSDYDGKKRRAVDEALTSAPGEVAAAVRDALLATEHVALGRRFRAFALDYIGPSFFREEAVGLPGPVPRSALDPALNGAYGLRSAYVHKLLDLPDPIGKLPSLVDWVRMDGRPALTFQGLARVARHVIMTFVARSPKVEREDLDYRGLLPNIVRVHLDESMWLGSPDGYDAKSARRYLGGFLNQLARWLSDPSSPFTDLHLVVEKAEALLPGLAGPQRVPVLTLYLLYNVLVPPDVRRPDWVELVKRYVSEFDTPSIEGLLAHVISEGLELDWTPEAYDRVWQERRERRYHRDELALAPILEAALALALAERNRRAGEDTRARALLEEAVELHPGQAGLMALEQQALAGPLPEIVWSRVLRPERLEEPAANVPDAAGPGANHDAGAPEAAVPSPPEDIPA